MPSEKNERRSYKRKRHAMSTSERKVFHMLENLNPQQYKSARAWAWDLVNREPSATKTVYHSLIEFWGLTGRFGYGDSAWTGAVSRWREANGYPLIGKGRPHWRRPCNWMPDDNGVSPEATEAAKKTLSEGATMDKDGTVKPCIDAASQGDCDGNVEAVAELVVEWMEKRGLYAVTFHKDGEIRAYKEAKKKRRFTMSIQEVDQGSI